MRQLPAFLTSILILIMITVSGCTLPSGMSGQGVVLEEFVAEPNDLQSGEPFLLRTRIRNVGQVKAEDMFVKIFNTDVGEFSDIQCMPNLGTTSNCEIFFSLLGADKEMNFQGESRTCTWNCLTPFIEKGNTVTYSPSIRIFYSYFTTTTKTILLASQDELKRLESQGEAITSQPITTTGGPVAIDIKAKGPVKFWPGLQQIEFPIEIDVQNIGGGVACTLGGLGSRIEGCDNPENWNKVVIVSNTFDVIFKDCDLELGRTVLSLWNQKGKLVCNAWMSVPYPLKNFQKNIDIEAVYHYFIDETISVNVRGTADIEVI